MLRIGAKYIILEAMNTKYIDLYTDYLAVTFGYATATGLSDMLRMASIPLWIYGNRSDRSSAKWKPMTVC